MKTASNTPIGHYPFGSPMPGRSFTSATYRYGFNGKENDNEVKGDGNQQDYGFRIYDPRLGKFLSVDPLTNDYPSWSPYPFAMNRPIDGVDLDGLEYSDAKTGKALGPLNAEYAASIGAVLDPKFSDNVKPTAPAPAKAEPSLSDVFKIANVPYAPPAEIDKLYTPEQPKDIQMAVQIGKGVMDGLVWETGNQVAGFVFSKGGGLLLKGAGKLAPNTGFGKMIGTFEGTPQLQFTFGMNVNKYVPASSNFSAFNRAGFSFTTNLSTSSSSIAYNSLGLGFRTSSGTINTMSNSYTVYQTSLRGFYLSGTTGAQGLTAGGATQYVGRKGFTTFLGNVIKTGTTY